MFTSGDSDNAEGGAEGGAEEAKGGGETQDGAAGGAVRTNHRRDAAETVGRFSREQKQSVGPEENGSSCYV